MAAQGVGGGDRVAVLTRNRIEFFELLFGCAKLGAVLVPLNWRMPPAELDGLIADAAPVLLFHGAEEAAAVAALAAPPPRSISTNDYEALARRGPAAPVARAMAGGGDLVSDLHVGDDGPPQGGDLHLPDGDGELCQYRRRDPPGLRPIPRPASFPIFHTAGINLHALPTLIAGGRVIVIDGFDAETLVELLEARRLDTVFAVPTVYQSLLDHPRFAAAPLAHVRHWGCGGAPLPDALAEAYRDLGVRVCNGMGMTETGPTAFLVDPADAWDRIGSVGKPQTLCSARHPRARRARGGGGRGGRPPVRRPRGDAGLLAQRRGDPCRLHRPTAG